MTTTNQKRSVNLDLLRILSMLLIIFLHSIDHSGVLEAAEVGGTPTFLYVRFTYQITQICVNLFVMISGYFLVKSEFKLKKLAALWLEVVFYSLVLRIIFMLTGQKPFSLLSILSCFVPVFTGRYWFVTIYFGLYLIFPFLNLAIHGMSKRQMTVCNIVLFLLFSVWISVYPSFAGMNSGRGWGLPWFVVLYFTGAWFRLNYVPHGKWGWKLALWPVLTLVVLAVFYFGRCRATLIQAIAQNWFKYDSVPTYLATLCVFAAFLNMDFKAIRSGDWIARISASTFGIYLIHAHADVSPWLWDKLDLPRYMGRASFPLFQLGIIAAIFIVCNLIDMARSSTIGRLETSRPIGFLCDRITSLFEKVVAMITEKV